MLRGRDWIAGQCEERYLGVMQRADSAVRVLMGLVKKGRLRILYIS